MSHSPAALSRRPPSAWPDVKAAHGRNRTCVKIAMTSAGVEAAVILAKEGIATLGTCLFNLHQAIAASQAGMYAVSMYFNGAFAPGRGAFRSGRG